MNSVKLKGAILTIGSLAWESEKNAIDRVLGLKRQAWRENSLDTYSAKKIKCPIRYGRKSSTRFNTFTMLFSNDTLINGTGLLIPLKNSININGSDFSPLYTQALNLARVEGICKDTEDSLVAKWGTIGIKISDSLKTRDPITYSALITFWESYFSGGVKTEQYRLGMLETPSINKDGFIKFDIENVDDFDFILCTSVIPNVSEYPDPSEIAKQMVASSYFTYFKENINHGITTYMDEEIYSFLPENVTSEIIIERKPINFSNYPNNFGGLNQITKDIRTRLGKSIYTPTLEGLCFHVLKVLDYPFEHKPGIHYEDIIRGIENAKLKFSEQFRSSDPYISKINKGNPLKEFISLTLYLEESPGEIEGQLEHKVLEDLRNINDLVLYYESIEYVRAYLTKNVLPRNHDERIVFDFYKRALNERQNIINYLCNGIKKRAFQKAIVRDDLFGLTIFDWYYDRPYQFAIPFSKGLFDYRNIDIVGHRLDRLSVTSGPKFRELYKTNKTDFYGELQSEFRFDVAIHEIKYYISVLPSANSSRKAIFEEMITFFETKKWFGFYGLALSQIEGLFQEMINTITPGIKVASLTDKVEIVRKKLKSDLHLDYYQYHIPFQRNKFMHSGIDNDLEIKSYDLLYDLHYLLKMYIELETPYMQLNSIMKRSDPMRFANIEDYASFLELLEETKKTNHYNLVEAEYMVFEKDFLCGHIDISSLVQQMASNLPDMINDLYHSIEEFTSYRSTRFDLRSSTKKFVKEKPDYYKDKLKTYFEENEEKFAHLIAYSNFLRLYKNLLPDINEETKNILTNLERTYSGHFEVIVPVYNLLLG